VNLVDELHAVTRVLREAGIVHHLILDLLVADASLQGLLDGRIEVALPEGTLSVVSKSALLEMKRLAGRQQDLADLAALEALPDAR
jgi:hypothetical protein